MTEQQFWGITPRKLAALADVHAIVTGQKESEEQKKRKKQEGVNFLKSMAGKV